MWCTVHLVHTDLLICCTPGDDKREYPSGLRHAIIGDILICDEEMIGYRIVRSVERVCRECRCMSESVHWRHLTVGAPTNLTVMADQGR